MSALPLSCVAKQRTLAAAADAVTRTSEFAIARENIRLHGSLLVDPHAQGARDCDSRKEPKCHNAGDSPSRLWGWW